MAVFVLGAVSCGWDVEQDVGTLPVSGPVFGAAGGPSPETGKQLTSASSDPESGVFTIQEIIGNYVGESTETWKECPHSSLNGTVSFHTRLLITPASNTINGTLTIVASPVLTVVYALRGFSIVGNVLGASIVAATTLQGDTLEGFESGEFEADVTEGSITFDYAWVNIFPDTTCRNVRGEGTLHKN